MIKSNQTLAAEQAKLTKWFAILSVVFVAVGVASYYWIHSVLLFVMATMFAPIFILLTIVFGIIALISHNRLKK